MLISKNVDNNVTMNPATHLRQHIKLVVCILILSFLMPLKVKSA